MSVAEVGAAAEEEVGGLEAKRLEWARNYTRDLLSACRNKAEGGGVRGMAARGATYLLLLLPPPPPPLLLLRQYLLRDYFLARVPSCVARGGSKDGVRASEGLIALCLEAA